jgi:Zn ribbon nucleic-acid-binding protein
MNKKKLEEDKKFIPVAYCPKCKKKQMLNITNMHKGKSKVSIGACGYCDTVLNLECDLKIEYVTEKEARKMGWKILGDDDND